MKHYLSKSLPISTNTLRVLMGEELRNRKDTNFFRVMNQFIRMSNTYTIEAASKIIYTLDNLKSKKTFIKK